jgi:hypothetical protein
VFVIMVMGVRCRFVFSHQLGPLVHRHNWLKNWRRLSERHCANIDRMDIQMKADKYKENDLNREKLERNLSDCRLLLSYSATIRAHNVRVRTGLDLEQGLGKSVVSGQRAIS